jgi:hypothetical protein
VTFTNLSDAMSAGEVFTSRHCIREVGEGHDRYNYILCLYYHSYVTRILF